MKEPVITLTLEEYEELRKEHECLEKEHAELQRKYEASLQEYSRQVEEISACTAVIADLRWKLADLTRRLWGKSSEKRHLPEDAGCLWVRLRVSLSMYMWTGGISPMPCRLPMCGIPA